MGLVARVVAAATIGVGLGGCAARPSMAPGEVESLRERVAELEAERRRQRRRIDDLAARVVALEGRSTRASRSRRELPVVRVRPPTEPREEEIDAPEVDESGEPEIITSAREIARPEADDGPRPVLKLHGASVVRGVDPVEGAPRRRRIELAAVTERLPVVPMPDAPLSAAPSGEAAEEPSVGAEPEPAAPSVEEVVAQARRQVASGDCGSALEALARVVADSPEHHLADDAMVLRAECMRRRGAHLQAIGELERMARRYPRSNRQADALLLRAESYVAIGDRERARELFGQVMRRFPRSRAASRATARVQELSRGVRAREER